MRVLFTFLLLVGAAGAKAEICTSETNVFTVGVNLNAGELGYFYFEECGSMVNPTIGMEVGQVYTFLQNDRSTYMHPLGFAYKPDGAHVDAPELEPSVTLGTSGCDATATCPAPMYMINGEYLGTYSNIPGVRDATNGEENFALDDYEPLFFRHITEWSSNNFTVMLNFDDATYDKDIFYFCHIHNLMSGRIKLLSQGEPINTADEPTIPYEYDAPSTYDETCGTYNLDAYQLPNSQCHETYVCNANSDNVKLQTMANCFDSMNCAMMQGMTTSANSDDPVALFIYHMIPHHQNAVNMAKALLHQNVLECSDLTEESDDCLMEGILRSIVNGQNMEIQGMRGYLEATGFASEDDCQVELNMTMSHGDGDHSTSDAASARAVSLITLLFLALAMFE